MWTVKIFFGIPKFLSFRHAESGRVDDGIRRWIVGVFGIHLYLARAAVENSCAHLSPGFCQIPRSLIPSFLLTLVISKFTIIHDRVKQRLGSKNVKRDFGRFAIYGRNRKREYTFLRRETDDNRVQFTARQLLSS